MGRGLLSLLRSGLVGPEDELARSWQARVADLREKRIHEEYLTFEQTTRMEPGDGQVALGRARRLDGTPFWAGISIERFLSMHSWVTGATGAGKTFLVLACLLQILRGDACSLILLDMKGELSALLLNLAIPLLTKCRNGRRILDGLRVVRPFDRQFVPELRVTLPEEGIPREVQSIGITAGMEDALGDGLGQRMTRVFHKLVCLAIERNEPLAAVQSWLERPETFQKLARSSEDRTVREYARGAFLRENRASLDALLARVDEFLFLPATRLALSTPGCLSFSDCLERGITIVDLGDPPAGAERVAQFWAGALIGRLMRAILSREVSDSSPRSWVLFEEFQEALARGQVEQFGRLLALARFKRVALTFINQQTAQIDGFLTKLLRTNTGMEAVFRSSFEDAKVISHALPVPRDTGHEAADRRLLLEELTRMPDRTLYLWLKQESFRAMKLRSPRLDLESMRAEADGVPDDVKQRIRRGSVAWDRKELEALLETPTDSDEECSRSNDVWLPAEEEPPKDDGGIPNLG